jgi:hypothetical protein
VGFKHIEFCHRDTQQNAIAHRVARDRPLSPLTGN